MGIWRHEEEDKEVNGDGHDGVQVETKKTWAGGKRMMMICIKKRAMDKR